MKKKYIIIIVLILIASGFGFYKWRESKTQNLEKYQFALVQTKDITQTVAANGTLNPVVMVSVGTQVSGTVQKLLVDYNSRVKEGQILAILDPVIFNSQLAQAKADVSSSKANLELAEANFNRSKGLFEKGYVSKQDYDQTLQYLKSAKASLELTRAKETQVQSNLNFSIIRSPVSGIVVDKQIDIGQTVAASFQTPTLFKIAKDLSKMQIDSSYAEADIGAIKVGQKAFFTVDAYPKQTFEGLVRQIRLNPTVQQNVVTYDVVVDFNNKDELLRPGMTAFVNIITAEVKGVLAVANSALRFKPSDFKREIKGPKNQKQTSLVFVLKDEKATPINVKIGVSDGKFTQIISNELKDGDQVITEESQVGQKNSFKPPKMF